MARLIVKPIADAHRAASGNRKDANIIVSVSHHSGKSVLNLEKSNFDVSAFYTPTGVDVHITGTAYAGNSPGVYGISVEPIDKKYWKTGQHIIVITVTKNKGRGQPLVSLWID